MDPESTAARPGHARRFDGVDIALAVGGEVGVIVVAEGQTQFLVRGRAAEGYLLS